MKLQEPKIFLKIGRSKYRAVSYQETIKLLAAERVKEKKSGMGQIIRLRVEYGIAKVQNGGSEMVFNAASCVNTTIARDMLQELMDKNLWLPSDETKSVKKRGSSTLIPN